MILSGAAAPEPDARGGSRLGPACDIIVAAGTIVSVEPHRPERGNATAAMLAPTPALRAAGAQIALATDNMHGDMVEAMRWLIAVARIQLGRIDDEWQPERALASATGSAELRPGDPADLVVIDLRRPHLTPAGDPLGTLVHCAHGRDVEHVIVAGRLIVEDGRSTTVDEDAIRREASERAARLWD